MTDTYHMFASDEPPEIQVHSHDRYHAVLKACAVLPPILTAIVHPVDEFVLASLVNAAKENLITPLLIGPAARIRDVAERAALDISSWDIIDVKHSHAAAEKAVELAGAGSVEAIMKGSLHTEELLSPVVASASGLRTERRLSHSYVMDTAGYHKWLIITDAVVNIAPDLSVKADICRNAADVWRALSDESRLPKIAVLAAVELVNPKMQATLDAAALSKMAERAQITGCIIDGPLGFDNAISRSAAEKKGIVSAVAGDPDILLAPDIEAANILAKQLTFINRADAAGIVMGGRVPIILASRADGQRTRILSCALAVLVLEARRSGRIK
ncbi:phosphate acetyltransferase [Chlorobium sp. BLA1]|uniref:phosphate acetyltransferase n=1 Tax=Candidatus Chlorobium masyuteum TaxID=2716876 RepID=UPI001421A251|nr:phosphate acetyltransferase [Candidatus Chlorobium masyuteum]NHQ60822.1 phosphate acetyltransferase [Candidatus Chlorobium masyuteum]NTU45510.1 phosphate acetyltransferase [Chlorobiaceae bacterium]